MAKCTSLQKYSSSGLYGATRALSVPGVKEQAGTTVIEIPSRWAWRPSKGDPADAMKELRCLGELLVKGTEALSGLYMRMCDLIRHSGLADDEVRKELEPFFSAPRISEMLRVSKSPENVYNKYRAGFFGFKAALRQTRGYRITPNQELQRRKLRRAAQRFAKIMGGPGKIICGKWIVSLAAYRLAEISATQ